VEEDDGGGKCRRLIPTVVGKLLVAVLKLKDDQTPVFLP
jgi:hypothetical protein